MNHSKCTWGSGYSCLWQIKGVLFWKEEEEKKVLWRVNNFFLDFACWASCREATALGLCLRQSRTRTGPQFLIQAGPLEDNGGPWTQVHRAAGGSGTRRGSRPPWSRRAQGVVLTCPGGPSLPLSSRITSWVTGLWALSPILRLWCGICQDLVSNLGIYQLSKGGAQGSPCRASVGRTCRIRNEHGLMMTDPSPLPRPLPPSSCSG